MTWKATRLKYLAQTPIVNGLGEAARDGDPTWPRYIRTTDIASSRSLHDDRRVTLPPALARQAPVLRDDLLLCAAGSLGKSYLHVSDDPACYAGYLVRFRADKRRVEPRFVAYWAQSTPFDEQVALGAVRSTIDNFSAGKYRDMSLAVPALDEQRRIADFLDDQVTFIDRAIALRRKQLDLMQIARARRLDIAIKAASREKVRLKYLLRSPLRYGAAEAASEAREDWPRYIRITDIDERGGLRSETFRSLDPALAAPYLLEHGDLLFARSGATVGKCFLYRGPSGAAAYAGYLIRAQVRADRLVPEFLRIFTESATYWTQIRSDAVQSTIQNMNAERYGNVLVPLPTIDDQFRLVAEAGGSEAANEAQEPLRRGVGLLLERRQALITAAVTGQFDVSTASVRGMA